MISSSSPSRWIVSPIYVLGEFSLFVSDTLAGFRGLWRRRGLFFRQCEFIGVTSLPIVAIAGMFMGAVLGYQLYVSFHLFHAEALLGGSIGVSLFRELAPVMTGVMVVGRAGAAMAAEIATMRVTEQIDALEVMAVDPVEFLVVPRVLAGLLMMPLLAIFFTMVASFAGAAVSCGVMGLDYGVYWDQYAKVADAMDVVHCVTKAAAFGLVLTWVSCFCGFNAEGGARAVGLATRSSVVASTLTILLVDYILTSFLPFGIAVLVVT
jgi:phospholipid/cholesterol/gamma-HCH transport system permease protein